MENQKAKMDFTSGKVFIKIILFILPIIVTNLLQAFYNAADMIIVSLSHEVNAVGAVGMTSSFINLIVNVFIGFSVGTNVMVARWIGAKKVDRAQNVVHTSVVMALLFGFIGMGLGLVVARPILTLMGAKENLLELAVTYTRIYFLGVPFISLSNYFIAIFRAKGDSKTPLIVLTIAGVLNVALNFFFVVGVGMSVEGVAIATAIANLFSAIALIWKLCKDDLDYTHLSFKKLKMDVKSFKDIVRVGLPAGIQSALFSISNMLIQSSIVTVNNNVCTGLEGDLQPIVEGAAAQGNLENFTYTAMNAVYQGAITFTSQNIGAKKPYRVRKIMYSCFAIVSAVGIFMALIMYLLRAPLLALYGIQAGSLDSLEHMAYEAALVRCYYLGLPYFLCGIMDVCTGVLRGLGKSLASTFVSLLGICVFRVIWLLTVFPIKQTLEVVFISYPISWILTIAVDLVFIRVLLNRILRQHQLENKE